jgi:hypothetical protein
MIRKLISTWMMALVGSILLPLISPATASGTTYDLLSTTTTAPATIAEHTVATRAVPHAETSLRGMANGQSRSLLGLSHLLKAPKSAASRFGDRSWKSLIEGQAWDKSG